MSKLMDKEAALLDFIEKYVAQQWQQEVIEITERYNNNKESIEKELLSVFDSLCKNATELQQQGEKGHIQYIYICFLRTRIMENTCFYKMDAYDENWFLDRKECSVLWDADFIFSSLFKHMEDIKEKKVEYARKITSMDIERIKLYEALKYHILALEFIREMIPKRDSIW